MPRSALFPYLAQSIPRVLVFCSTTPAIVIASQPYDGSRLRCPGRWQQSTGAQRPASSQFLVSVARSALGPGRGRVITTSSLGLRFVLRGSLLPKHQSSGAGEALLPSAMLPCVHTQCGHGWAGGVSADGQSAGTGVTLRWLRILSSIDIAASAGAHQQRCRRCSTDALFDRLLVW
jgi:hypothetical protein